MVDRVIAPRRGAGIPDRVQTAVRVLGGEVSNGGGSSGDEETTTSGDLAQAQMLARTGHYAAVIDVASGVQANIAQALGRRETPGSWHQTANTTSTATANYSRAQMLAAVGHPSGRIGQDSGVSTSVAQMNDRRHRTEVPTNGN